MQNSGNYAVNAISLTLIIVCCLPGCAAQYSAWDDVVKNDSAEAIRKIEDGADYKGEGYTGNRLTHWAARHGQDDVIEVLLERGLRVDRNNRSKSTPLMIAIGFENLSTAKYLIENGADVNHRNEQGFTPLYIAVLNSNDPLIDLLIANGANANAPGPHGATPLHEALQAQNTSAVELLVNAGATWDSATDYGDTTLHWAVSSDNSEFVESAIENGVDVNSPNSRGDTPLIVASALGSVELTQVLLERGATHDVNRDGAAPLHFAVASGQIDLVKKLVSFGADPNQADKRGWTPILIAAGLQDFEIVDFLAPIPSEAELSKNSGEASFASARQLFHSGKPADIETAKQYLLLAHTQFLATSERLAESAQSSLAAERAGQMFGAAMLGALQDQQQQMRMRQMNQLAALNVASQSGGGYVGYQRALEKIEANSVSVNAEYITYIDPGYGDVGLRMVKSKAAKNDAAEVSALIAEKGWSIDDEMTILPPPEIKRSWLTGAPEDFERAPGFWGGDTDEFCEVFLPVPVRSLAGTGKFMASTIVMLEDEYEVSLAPIHFLWEMPQIPSPSDGREAACAKAVYIAQCKYALDWIDEIRHFDDKCQL